MDVVAVCAFEQFVVAKKGIEKQSEDGDAEALANVDEAVVLESDKNSIFGVGLDCRTPSLSLDLSLCLSFHRASGPCFTMQQRKGDWRSSTPW